MLEHMLLSSGGKKDEVKPGTWRKINPVGGVFNSIRNPMLGYRDGWLYILGGAGSGSYNYQNACRKVNVSTGEVVNLPSRTVYQMFDAFFQPEPDLLVGTSYMGKAANGTTYTYYNRGSFNMATETWTEMAPITANTVANNEQGFTSNGVDLYTYGGSDGNTWQSTVRNYNWTTGVAKAISGNITGRSGLDRGAAIAYIDGKIIGHGGLGQTTPYKNTVFEFDITAGTSKTLLTLSGVDTAFSRTYGTGIGYRGLHYAFFGQLGSNGANATDISVFNPVTKKFSVIKGEGAQPPARFYSTGLLVGDKAYFVGGLVGSSTLNDVWEYTFR